MQSSKDRKFLGILNPSEAESFLEGWANLQPQGVADFLQHHKVFFPAEIRSVLGAGCRSRQASIIGEVLIHHRDWLRKGWESKDPFRKSWYLSTLMISFSAYAAAVRHKVADTRKATQATMDMLIEPPSQPSLIDAAILYLQVVTSDLSKVCLNDRCERPYFFGTKSWQRYCCDDCKHPSVLAQKLKWWETSGSKQRAKKTKRG